jgi:hypothetical protein
MEAERFDVAGPLMEKKAVMESTTERPRFDLVEHSFGIYGPACRYRLASELLRVVKHRTAESCDEHVLAAHDYFRLRRSGLRGSNVQRTNTR